MDAMARASSQVLELDDDDDDGDDDGDDDESDYDGPQCHWG